tara:strand:+ start:615 stop:971 length:357 start_codon:yes stop_codon:yes gene_type:complete
MTKIDMRQKPVFSDGSSSIDDATPQEWDAASKAIRDAVNHPPHYSKGEIETIDYLVDTLGMKGAIAYCHGNVIKYTGMRLFNKGKTVEDARKAIWYLNKLIELTEDDNETTTNPRVSY